MTRAERRHPHPTRRSRGAARRIAPWLALAAAACGSSLEDRAPAPRVEAAAADPPGAAARGAAPADAVPAALDEHDCALPVPVWRDGERDGEVCPDDARAEGLTVVDLSDGWTPRVFREAPALGAAGASSYRARYLRHAAEEHLPGTPAWRRRRPPASYLELYGIFPNVAVVRARLLDRARHACHAAVEDDALDALEGVMRPRSDGGRGAQLRRARWVARTERELEAARVARGLDSIAALGDDPRWGDDVRKLRAHRRPVDALRAVQGHLACDGLLDDRAEPAVFDRHTLAGLERWQRKHMIVSNGVLDEDTRHALARPSDENDFRTLLRVLRERVVDAAGLLADGTAAGDVGTVLGRSLDPPELRVTAEAPALPGAAPDEVSPATEAAALALGWTDAAAAAAWLAALPEDGTATLRVAVPLPPPAPWHAPRLDVVARIDRGDVSYAFPFFEDGRPRWRPMRARPTLRLAVRHEGREIPLVRWSTTIGGWHRETGPDGVVGLAYKNSPVGPRVWRDVVASPTWMPPPATPDDELLRAGPTLVGPGYESAYGLVMIQHHRVFGAEVADVVAGRATEGARLVGADGAEVDVRFGDEGIRTHGSVSYRSMLSGESHGCHRLFNHLAVRLAGWLVSHRAHVRHGPQRVAYRRTLVDPDDPGAEPVELEVDTRGDVFELTPPVEVVVEEGTIRGRPRRPIAGVVPIPSPPTPDAATPADG